MDAVEIPLTQGRVALVDAIDAAELLRYPWHFAHGYARRTTRNEEGRGRKSIYMHRAIMAAPPELEVDHISGDGLNNRRANLRTATVSQNRRNARRHRDNTSGFKGVTWHKGWRRWQAGMNVGGAFRYLGSFRDPVDAARAYDAAAREVYGEFAKLNFPDVDMGV